MYIFKIKFKIYPLWYLLPDIDNLPQQSLDISLSFLWIIQNRRLIVRPQGQSTWCLLWVHGLSKIVALFLLYCTCVIADGDVSRVCSISVRYSTRLYLLTSGMYVEVPVESNLYYMLWVVKYNPRNIHKVVVVSFGLVTTNLTPILSVYFTGTGGDNTFSPASVKWLKNMCKHLTRIHHWSMIHNRTKHD